MKESIKLIFGSVRQYKKYAIITPLFMIGEVLLETMLPFVMSMLIDTIEKIETIEDMMTFYPYTKFGNMQVSVFLLIVVLVSFTFLSLFCGIMGGRTAAKASAGMAANLRNDIYRKIQTFSFANIDKFSASSLITRMTTDIQYVSMSFSMLIRIVFRAPLMMIFAAIMAFVTGGPLALIFVGLVFVVGLGLYLVIRSAMKIFKVLFPRFDKLNESVQENVSAIRVVKSFVREDYEKKKFNKASDDIAVEFIKAEKIVALNGPIMNTGIHVSNVLVIGLGAYLIASTVQGIQQKPDGSIEILYGSLTIGQMSSLITYGIQILTSVMMVSIILVMLALSIESVRRIGEVLKEEPTITNPENPIMEVPNGDVTFNNVRFKYVAQAEKNTLEDINISVKSGQFIGILGTTGSGKTSVVNLVSRLYDVSEGEVLVGNHNVKEYDLITLRDAVAVVLQKNVLFSGTIASNLLWGDENATEEDMKKACDIAQISDFIESLPDKYQSHVEQGGNNFSGGQKQRLCIARAILKKPKILILDDSTSAVDTKTDRQIRKALKEDLPEMTKIVIAQRISSIEDADQIIIMDDGHINEIGTHADLLKHNSIYQEIYYTQNRVGGNQ